MLNESAMKGIIAGIKQGFIEKGYTLDDRDELIIEVTATSTLGTIAKLLKDETGGIKNDTNNR